MKPYELVAGDFFRVTASCEPEETEHVFEVVSITTKAMELRGRSIVTGVRMEVRLEDGSVELLGIGPWVEVEKLLP
jgi:hypothetical protein